MKTLIPKKDEINRNWYLVDAENKILGRLASKLAEILRGKHKPIFTPHLDTGDFVVVINAEKVRLTGKKLEGKVYYRHSGYPGGLKAERAKELKERKPENLILGAVKGMLPKNKLGNQMIKKLKVYKGEIHPHKAQNPQVLEI